ncbi:MAG: hypothetical protein AAGJ83_10245, partial [Planctomycetota bacterium]
GRVVASPRDVDQELRREVGEFGSRARAAWKVAELRHQLNQRAKWVAEVSHSCKWKASGPPPV